MKGAFVLPLYGLDAAGKRFTAELTVAWLLGALEGCGVDPAGEPGEVDVRYSKAATDVIVKGTVRAKLQSPCARCLEPARFEANAELSLLLVPDTSPRAKLAKGHKGPPDGEITAEEAALDTYSGDDLALDPFVREALLLEVPPFPLCSDDCEGIRPPPDSKDPGPSIDPRLAPLLELAAKQKPKKHDRKD